MRDNKTTVWLGKAVGRHKRNLIVLMLLQTAINGGAVFYALFMKNIIDCAVEKNRQGFFTAVFLFAALIVTQLLLRGLLRLVSEVTRSSLENTLKRKHFDSLLTKDYAQVTAVHSEEWMNRMTSDTTVCANALTDILPGVLGMVVRLGGALLMIFMLQPLLAYIMLPCGILFLFITMIFRRYLKSFHKQMQEKDGALRVYLQERVSSMLILRTFGAEENAMEGAEKRMAEHKRARMRKALLSNLCNIGFSAAMNGMYLMGMGYCGYGILNGFVSYGTLTAILQLIGQLQAPLSGISGFVPQYFSMLASAERLMEVESYKDADTSAVKSMEETMRLYGERLKSVVFREVSFSYGRDKEQISVNSSDSHVLRSVNLSIAKGDYIAFTGLSGCGKSTLLKLLMGIYEPTAGNICMETHDGESLSVRQWRKLFAYVPQGNYLMGGTIREVITFGREEKGNTLQSQASVTVEQALELACAEFVFDLPRGVETLLGEKGAGLSEGQMQRIAIARAIYADSPILILDEATSALDEQTEGRFLKKMKELTDKTVLIVTHRAAALDICNKQFDFVKGEVIE